MTEHQSALNLLQMIALTLPAIALYVNVLTEIHMVVARKTGLQIDPDSPHLTGQGGKIEWEPDPYTARFTSAIKQPDFALSLLSLGILLISAMLFIVYVALSIPLLLDSGTGTLVLGFIALFLAVGWTFSISVKNIWNARQNE